MNEQINIEWVDPNPMPDSLQIYFGEPYKVTDKIVLKQPTVQDIIDLGEKDFYSALFRIIGNTTTFRLFLWNCGIDWNKMRDFELFRMWVKLKALDDKFMDVFFTDIHFSQFDEYMYYPPPTESDIESGKEPEGQIVLYDVENEILITEAIYKKISYYYKTVFNIFPKTQKTRGKTTKQWLIEEDIRNEKIKELQGNKSESSTLMPLISFCLNHPGFKYKKNELRELTISEFMDSVNRLQAYEITRAATTGSFSGFVDTSKMDKKLFDFTRNLSLNKIQNNGDKKDKNQKQVNAFSSLKTDDGTLDKNTKKIKI